MKNAIIKTSLEQFLKHGIRKTSMQKLVGPLGISTKTVYKYFTNKEDLLREALLYYYDQHYQAFERYSEKENVVVLLCSTWYIAMETETKVNQIFFHDLLYYYTELNEKIYALSIKKFVKIFIRIIKRGINEGLFKEDIVPELVLHGMFILYTAIVRNNHLKKLNLIPLDLLRNTLLIYISGICTRKGIQQFDEHVQNLQLLEKPGHIQKKVSVNPLNLN